MSDADDDDISRKRRESERLARLERAHDHLFGFEGEGGRLATMDHAMKAQRAEYQAALRVVDVRLADQETRQRATDLFQHQIRWTVAAASGIAVVVAGILLKAFDYLTR